MALSSAPTLVRPRGPSSRTRTARRYVASLGVRVTFQRPHPGPIDPLHYGQHPLLWCRNRCRYRIHDRPHLFQHGAPRTLDWSQAASSDRHDHAQADALQVRSRSMTLFRAILNLVADTKDMLVLLLYLEGWTSPDPNSSPFTLTVPRTSSRT